ncbi:MAG: undecaprenyl-phosphate glucose phosphotransferase [Robiginitomaculum sp.]|nr:undecaprenyl-phosphate glucose phosphotransferase [Robiginitomaculum sp.]MDQ7078546.1 undecaprenyl-phosphate glucose phosphotransferase [Robiginitomaculum sp.]
MPAKQKQQNQSQKPVNGLAKTVSPPLAHIVEGPPREALALPIPTRSRINKILAIRIFQSLDALVVAGAAVVGCMRASGVPLFDTAFGIAAPFLVMPFFLLWGGAAFGAYDFDFRVKSVQRWAMTALAVISMSVTVVLAARIAGLGGHALSTLVLANMIAVLALLCLHLGYNALVQYWCRHGAMASNVVIVGATKNARRLVRQSEACKDLNVVAIFDDRGSRRPGKVGDIPVAGGVKDLLAWEGLHAIDKIIITVTSTASNRVNELIDQLRALPQEVVLFMDLEGFNPEQARLTEIARSPMAYVSGAPRDEWRVFAKRLQDLVFASAMLVLFAPIMVMIALLIRLDSPGPVLFKQKRHGFNNRIIEVFKFRTMRLGSDAGPMKQVQANDPRVTRIGRFLRRTSLDELPQLFNVLAGNMSLVGPRPHAVGMRTGEVESWKLVAHYAHRHRVKPGLTGWAQINGSRGPLENAEQVRERVRLDLEYIRRAGFWFDLWIMIKTVPCLLGDREAIR